MTAALKSYLQRKSRSRKVSLSSGQSQSITAVSYKCLNFGDSLSLYPLHEEWLLDDISLFEINYLFFFFPQRLLSPIPYSLKLTNLSYVPPYYHCIILVIDSISWYSNIFCRISFLFYVYKISIKESTFQGPALYLLCTVQTLITLLAPILCIEYRDETQVHPPRSSL